MGTDQDNGGCEDMLVDTATAEDRQASSPAKGSRSSEDEPDCSGCSECSDVPEEYPRTITGVIRIMRSNGSTRAAEFMEEVKDTKRQAERLLESLRKLHTRKTGHYPQVAKKAGKRR